MTNARSEIPGPKAELTVTHCHLDRSGEIFPAFAILRAMKTYWVYIVTNSTRTVLYIGVTNSIERRTNEHKSKRVKGFTSKYNCGYLLYYEETSDIKAAIAREKQLKKWSRAKKEQLVDTLNPRREDLSTPSTTPVEMTVGNR